MVAKASRVINGVLSDLVNVFISLSVFLPACICDLIYGGQLIGFGTNIRLIVQKIWLLFELTHCIFNLK